MKGAEIAFRMQIQGFVTIPGYGMAAFAAPARQRSEGRGSLRESIGAGQATKAAAARMRPPRQVGLVQVRSPFVVGSR